LAIYSLGIDFGTSGARAVCIDAVGTICAGASYGFEGSSLNSGEWRNALFFLIEQIPQALREKTSAIAVNGTSSTVLLCDRQGIPLDAPILYNDARGAAVGEELAAIAPPNHLVLSATSSLAKLLWWSRKPVFATAAYFLHQADWLAFLLHGQQGVSDYHNALKLGYDPARLRYPVWLERLPFFPLLPRVLSPGTPIGTVTPAIARRFHLPPTCQVCAGTTDSIAAFLASGATQPGEAVTSLGSTLVLKLLSRIPVESPQHGIYSHRLGELWLAGGASNAGGAVLRHFFSDDELRELSDRIDPNIASSLEYYPLLQKGDRFPINDPELPPNLEPRPDDPVEFLHGLLESLARIEAQGYQLLQQLGATELTRVYTAGGGAQNPTWTAIRDRHLPAPIVPSKSAEAAFGTALLAQAGIGRDRVPSSP